MRSNAIPDKLLRAAKSLKSEAGRLRFSSPVTHVYNPLEYAWKPYKFYIEKYAAIKKKVVFLGMNPGPFGMAQVGVPFGEISYVRGWLGIYEEVGKPAKMHSKRPIDGFNCTKSEKSGKRLWGLFEKIYKTPDNFFRDNIVMNYCPLAFMDKSGRNITPDKLKPREKEKLFMICDAHLEKIATILEPQWMIGIGNFTWSRCGKLFGGGAMNIGRITHPSPANPSANRGWEKKALSEIRPMGIWNI